MTLDLIVVRVTNGPDRRTFDWSMGRTSWQLFGDWDCNFGYRSTDKDHDLWHGLQFVGPVVGQLLEKIWIVFRKATSDHPRTPARTVGHLRVYRWFPSVAPITFENMLVVCLGYGCYIISPLVKMIVEWRINYLKWGERVEPYHKNNTKSNLKLN